MYELINNSNVKYSRYVVKDSFALITHSKTNEIRPFGTEQKKYNEEQISVLTELETKFSDIRYGLLEYTEKTKAAYMSLPSTTKKSDASRAVKEGKHKGRKRKLVRHTSLVIEFLNRAIPSGLIDMYFEDGSVDPTTGPLCPLTLQDIDVSVLHDFKPKQRTVITNFLCKNHNKWIALDVVHELKNMQNASDTDHADDTD